MVASNHTRSRVRTRRSQQAREEALAAELASAVEQCKAASALCLNDSAEPREAAAPVCLYVRSGSEYLPASTNAILDHVRRWATERHRPDAEVLDSPRAVEMFLLAQLATREVEVVAVILLDKANRFIDYVELAQGTRDSAPIPMRAVLKTVLRYDAQGVILAHNHPSGSAEPSYPDILATQRAMAALKLLHVRLVDHFIIADQVTSFVERGLIPKNP